jgi:hypothetical protein
VARVGIGLTLDRFPVVVGAVEPPSTPRGVAARKLLPALDAADGDGGWRPGCCVEKWRKSGRR